VEKYAAISPALDERARRIWAAAESRAIGYGGDALVSAATGLARDTIRKGRLEIVRGVASNRNGRVRRMGAGRPRLTQRQPGLATALERMVDPLTRGDPMSPLRWTCKSRAKLASALSEDGWQVSSTTVGRLLNGLGYRLQGNPSTSDVAGGACGRYGGVAGAAACRPRSGLRRAPSVRRRSGWASARRSGKRSRSLACGHRLMMSLVAR